MAVRTSSAKSRVRESIRCLTPLEAIRTGTTTIVENVGNLVCTSGFDLGEDLQVVMVSTTEGEDKPLKYPHMFRSAQLVLLTKVDLLPHLDFNLEKGGTIRGTVLGIDGLPASGATIQVYTEGGTKLRSWSSSRSTSKKRLALTSLARCMAS